MLVDFKTKDTKKALPMAILLIAVALFLVSFITSERKNPPDEELFVSVALADFGNYEPGSGDVESENPSENMVDDKPETSQETETTPTETAPAEVTTQETSTITKQTSDKTTTETTKTDTKPKEETVNSNLQNAFDKINDSGGGGGSQGDGGGDGNEGAKDGKIGGSGVFGNGVPGGFSLNGRGNTKAPSLNDKITEEGTVIVDILVDRNGNVIKATVNKGKTKTVSQKLWNLAIKAAKTAKFNVDNSADYKQAGTITIVFKLD